MSGERPWRRYSQSVNHKPARHVTCKCKPPSQYQLACECPLWPHASRNGAPSRGVIGFPSSNSAAAAPVARPRSAEAPPKLDPIQQLESVGMGDRGSPFLIHLRRAVPPDLDLSSFSNTIELSPVTTSFWILFTPVFVILPHLRPFCVHKSRVSCGFPCPFRPPPACCVTGFLRRRFTRFGARARSLPLAHCRLLTAACHRRQFDPRSSRFVTFVCNVRTAENGPAEQSNAAATNLGTSDKNIATSSNLHHTRDKNGVVA